MFQQVKFRIINEDVGDPKEILGGIGEYDGSVLLRIICGCCGSVMEPDDVEVITKYEYWGDLCEAIVGDDWGKDEED